MNHFQVKALAPTKIWPQQDFTQRHKRMSHQVTVSHTEGVTIVTLGHQLNSCQVDGPVSHQVILDCQAALPTPVIEVTPLVSWDQVANKNLPTSVMRLTPKAVVTAGSTPLVRPNCPHQFLESKQRINNQDMVRFHTCPYKFSRERHSTQPIYDLKPININQSLSQQP